MIVSVNPKPSLKEFSDLMMRTDKLLNEDAIKRPKYYASRGGNPLEDDVKAALDESAVGTSFAGTIEKVSGQRFPDIVAAKFYGVEVKSTKDDHWTSTGSSILETTRVSDVERIYMTDELLLILADMADVSPEQVRMIVDAYEKATTGVKPVPEDYTIFKYEGKRYAYKSLGVGSWTPQCASLKLMKVLRNYFISSGKMEEGGCWPGSGCHWAWTGDVVELYSNGGTGSGDDFFPHPRFAVIPL